MSFADNLQYRTENLSLYFQGGVRRSLLIFAGICIVMLVPLYFLGQQLSNLWSQASFNSNQFNGKNIVIPKNLVENPLIIGDTQVVKLANGTNTLYLTINNKTNPEVGYFPYVYTTQILNKSGDVLSQQKYSSYLLPGDIKYIVANSSDPNGVELKIIREPDTQAISYNPNQTGLSKAPKITIKDQTIQTDAKSDNVNIRTLFKNEDTVYVDRVDITYIIRDGRDSVVGIGLYTFSGFYPNTERDVNLTYPKPQDRLASQIDVRWSVNYLDKSLIKII